MTESEFKAILAWYMNWVESNEGVTCIAYVDIAELIKEGLSKEQAEILLAVYAETGLEC